MKKLWAASFLLFGLLHFSASEISAQNYIIDSLENRLLYCKTDSAKVMVLVELTFNTISVDTIKALRYSDTALKISRQVSDPRVRASALRARGVLYESSFRHDEALRSFYEGLHIIAGRTDLFSEFMNATIKFDIGNSYLFRGNLSSAIPYYLETQHFFENKLPNNIIRVFLYNNMSNAYLLAGIRQKGLMYTEKAVALAERLENKRAIAHAYALRGLVELDNEKPDIAYAKSIIEKSKTYAEDLNDMIVLGFYHSFQSALSQRQGNLSKALVESKQSVFCFSLIHHHLFAGEEMIAIAGIEVKLGRPHNAFQSYFKAMELGNKSNCAFLKRQALKGLGQTSEAIQQIPVALNYYRRFQQLNDSLSAADVKEQIFVAESQQESHLQQEQIVSLVKEKQLQQLELRQKRVDNKFLVVAIIAAVAILILTFLYLRGKQKIIIQQNELQQKRISELEKDRHYVAVESLLQGQEEERSRIARDIHDGLGSMLSSAKHNLTSMKGNVSMTSDSVIIFNKSVDLIDSSMKELRRVAHNMMPEALIRFGLKDAVHDFCESLNNNVCKIEFVALNLVNRFESAKEIVVYRIVQELVTNTLKHAEASKVLVQLVQDDNLITLTVEDNGVGFDVEALKTNRGAGWTNIYSRVSYLNGKLEVDSKPSLGTSVIIEFYV
jgi:signal transduction histidine kinase